MSYLLAVFADIEEDRKKFHWRAENFFGAVGSVRVEQQAVARLDFIQSIRVPIFHRALEYVKELDTSSLVSRPRLRVLVQCDHVRFDRQIARQDMADQSVDMTVR